MKSLLDRQLKVTNECIRWGFVLAVNGVGLKASKSQFGLRRILPDARILRCCLHLYLDLSLDLREVAHSRPVSQISFRQPVETITAPCLVALSLELQSC